MGSRDSSPDDPCAKCGALRQDHVAWGQRHLFVPDSPCRCGHPRAGHSTGPCLGEVLVAMGTDRENCRCRAFVPAGPDGPEPRCEGCGHTDAEGCGCPPPELYEPEALCPCIREGGCCHAPGVCLHGCAEAADEVTRLGEEMEPEAGETHGEPEAPETYTAGWAERPDLGCARPDGCTDKLKRRCGSGLDGCAFAAQLRGERLVPRDGAAPPRPPYAVAYATGSGVLNEIALPGDATAAVTDGALVISHPSGVLGIQHVKPWEGP